MSVAFDKLLGQPLLHTHLGAIIATGTSNPASGVRGELFYNTSDSTLYIFISSWIAIGSSSGGGGASTYGVGTYGSAAYA